MRKILMSMISMGLMAFATSAQAGSATGTTVVTAAAVNSCTVLTGSAAAFGNYTGTQIDLTAGGGAGSIGFRCNVISPVTIALDAGLNYSGTTRRMADGRGDFLAYELFQDSAFTTLYGDAGVTHPGPAAAISATSPAFAGVLYARMAANANYVPQNYSDQVGITLSF